MGKFTKHLQTATIVRKSKIRYIQFDGKNYELIVDYIMSKNWDNDLLSESSESIIMNAEEWKKFSENLV